MYDVVTEDQYRSIVKGRLEKDDFIVDDGTAGYTDNGMDDWTGADEESEEDAVISNNKCEFLLESLSKRLFLIQRSQHA